MTTRPEELVAGLQRFGLERDRMRAALAAEVGVNATDLDALEHLEADGPLAQSQLGARLSLTSGAITMLVDRLEQAGWVRRTPHPRDRRSTLVELSAQALARLPGGMDAYHARVRTVAGRVRVEEREAILGFLRAAAAAAADAAEEMRHDNRTEKRP
ncbi:MAG: MarR family transcriptional regulator [Acidimicrobiales bacterium]